NADSLVVDGHLGAGLLIGEGDHGDTAASRGVLDRVVEQVEQRLLQPTPVTPDDEIRLDPDAHGVPARIYLEVIDDIPDELGEVQPLEVIAELAVLDPVDGG